VTIVTQDWALEGRQRFSPANTTTAAVEVIAPASHSGGILKLLASNGDAPTIVGSGVATLGGISAAGPFVFVKTNGAPTDADFTAATPAYAIPPVGTFCLVLSSAKLYVKTATAAAWASSVALT
jgi:hypothetical protein